MGKLYEGIGTIEKVLGNNNYQVEVEISEEGRVILCHLSGKMRRFKINVIAGDEVTVEVPYPYDKGRITFRGKKEDRLATGGQKRTKERKRPKGRGGRRG